MRSIALILVVSALANSATASVELSLKQRGQATFKFLGAAIYDAKLFTPQGEKFRWEQDFGLKLTYKRSINQKTMVQSTLREMKRLGMAAPIEDQLLQCFDDVKNGDTYFAVSDGRDRLDIQRNGTKVCSINHPNIKRQFMSIFLGDNTRSSAFTLQLRGQ